MQSSRIALFVSSLAFITLVGCGSNNDNKSAKKATSTSSTEGGYEALQEKAEAFRPEIGKHGGEIVLSTFSDPKSFNPITSTETSTSEYTAYMYEGLVETNGVTLQPEPGLAERWERSDDGLVWTFFIRPGVIWSDSVPFSAYDVEFTFNDLIYNRDINPNSARDILLIEGKEIKVEVLDSNRVQFTLPFPYAPFLRVMSLEILPKHAYEKYVKNGTFPNELGIKTPPKDMVVSGAFMLDSYISGQKVVLKRNPLYWKKDADGNRLPYLERVVYKIVADQNAELLQFLRGEIDYLGAKGEDFPTLKKDEKTNNFTVYRLGPARGSSFLFFNQNTGSNKISGKQYVDPVKLSWFRNVNFRRAIAHALDKENMISIVMNGLGYPQWSSMAPSEGYFYNPDVPKYPYDVEKSKQILAEEGFEDRDGDGIIEDKDGNPVKFSLLTNSGNNVRVKIAEIIRKDLERIGIQAHFQQVEFNSLIQKIDNPPFAWDAILLGLTGGVEPHFGNNVWQSSGTLHMWFPRQKEPSTPWEARIDSLFNAGVKEIDRKKRKAIYDEWQYIVAEQLPLIYTVLSERILCISNTFGNLNPSMNGGLLHNMEYFFVK